MGDLEVPVHYPVCYNTHIGVTKNYHVTVHECLFSYLEQKRILHPYSMDFNHKYNFTGHLFESRYTSCLVEDERYFLEVSRYIHLNPVKARMVREPLDYEYSSYGKFVSNGSAKKKSTKLIEELVETDRVLGVFHNNSSEQYRMFVEGKISHAEQEMLIQKDMKEDDMWLPW